MKSCSFVSSPYLHVIDRQKIPVELSLMASRGFSILDILLVRFLTTAKKLPDLDNCSLVGDQTSILSTAGR